jgi:hypothetical protein
MVKMMSEKVSISISKDLFDLIKKQVENSDGAFTDIEEYVEFVLSEVIKEEAGSGFTSDEEEQIKERLKNLGYIE